MRRDGLYARSRFRCYPAAEEGKPPHTFTLPKRAQWHLHPDGRTCPACSHEAGRTDGAPTAIQAIYSVPEAAQLLFECGRGSSLREASRTIRIENGRWSVNAAGDLFRSRQNALAADYLDRYGPTLAAATVPRRWPRFVVLDSTPLHIRVREAETLELPYETDGGALLVAAGTDDPRQPARAWHAALAGNETGLAWWDFLDSIITDEAPVWVVADDADAIRNAVHARWPDAVLFPCLYHLRERGREAARADGILFRDNAIEPALDVCLTTTDHWERLRALARPHGGALWQWIEATDEKARSLEPLRRRFGADVPQSNGAAEFVVREIVRRIGKRKRNFLNAGRLGTLITLMRADLAGVASARNYTRVLRQAQEAADWALGHAEDPNWSARHDPWNELGSISRLILDAQERAKLDLADIVRESQARSVARKLADANAARAALGLPALELRTTGAVPTVKVPKGTMLSAFPELLRDWDPANDRDPATISYGASYVASWICAECGNRWTAPVCQRVLRRTRCRACHRAWATPETSLAAQYPELVATDWAVAENRPLCPERLTIRSQKAVLWRCRDYPDLHPLFPMSAATRVKRWNAKQPACPECRRAMRARKGRRSDPQPSN